LVPNRHGSSSSYRYGFQGQEKDDEIKGGEGKSLNYTFRMHDPRVGRFFAVDPLTAKYPFYSPYQFSGNRLIDMVELEGMEPTYSGCYPGEGAKAPERDCDGVANAGTDNYRWTWNDNDWHFTKVGITNYELTTLFPNGNSKSLSSLETTINLYGSSNFGLNDSNKVAHFLGQTGHESGGFNKLSIVESAYYKSVDRVKDVFGSESNAYLSVEAEESRILAESNLGKKNISPNKYLFNTERFTNMAYANKGGNGDEDSGDGFLYRGRGLIQLTLSNNYKNFFSFYNKVYGTTYIAKNDASLIATNRDLAIISSLWYFSVYTIPEIDKNGSTFHTITKTVNAKCVDEDKRKTIYNRSLELLNK
jgi:RHS repeat-associated protein